MVHLRIFGQNVPKTRWNMITLTPSRFLHCVIIFQLSEYESSRDFCWTFNEVQLVTTSPKLDLKVPDQKLLIQVLIFAFLVKVNSNFWKLVFKCIELEAQETKASPSAQNCGRKDLNFSLHKSLKPARYLELTMQLRLPIEDYELLRLSSRTDVNDVFKLNKLWSQLNEAE